MARRIHLLGRTTKVGCEFFCGGLFFFLGVLFVIVLPSMWFPVIKPFGDDQITAGVVDNAIVTSNASTGFAMWETNNAPDAPPYLLAATFYNLTNPDEVQFAHAVPNFVEVGPYYYVYNRTKFNIDWMSDQEGNNVAVSYNEYRRMGYLPELSGPGLNPDTDIITNINPAFMAVLNTAGGFNQIFTALGGPATRKLFDDFLTTTFVEHMLIERMPLALVSLSTTFNFSDPSFLSTWANATVPPAGYDGMILSFDDNDNPSEIASESAAALWSDANYGLLNTFWNVSEVWYNATKLPEGSEGQTEAANLIAGAFNLSPFQAGLVFDWINSVNFTARLQTYIIGQYSNYPIASLSDLGYLQWMNGNLTNQGKSVVELYGWEYTFPIMPNGTTVASIEYPTTLGPDYPTDLDDLNLCKFLLNDTNVGLFNPTPLGVFCTESTNYDYYNELLNTWDFTSGAQIGPLSTYFCSSAAPIYGQSLFTEDIVFSGGGLVVNRAVNDWLFNATDPMLLYVQPNDPKAALLRNDSSEADSILFPPSIYMTGVYNNSQVSDIVSWAGQTELVGVYAVTVPVYGTNDWGQFQPFITQGQPLNSFSEDYMRTFDLYYNNTIYDYYDLGLYRYMVNQSSFDVNPELYLKPGFEGFANLTAGHNDTPIYLSNPHFAGVTGDWTSLIQGIVPNALNDTTVIDIDPTTGSVLHVYQASQINLYMVPGLFEKNSTSAYPYFENMTAGVFYPIAWIAESATVNQVNAEKLRQVYFIKDVFAYGIYICFVFGLLLWLIAGAFLAFAYRHYHQRDDLLDSDYDSIQDK